MKATILIILNLYSVFAFSQNRIYFVVGANRPLVYNEDPLIHTSGKYGLGGGVGIERGFKKYSFSLDINCSTQNYEILVGPLFFPDDLPTSNGSFFNTNIHSINFNVLPSINFNIYKNKLFIPLGLGVEKTFYRSDTQLHKANQSISSTHFAPYQIPGINVFLNTGLILFFKKANKPTFFLTARYHLSLLPMKPNLPDLYSKSYINSLSVSCGIMI